MNKRKSYHGGFTILAFTLGVIGGLFIPNVMLNLSFIGQSYVSILKFLVTPVLFFGIVEAVGTNTKNVLWKTVLLFTAMFSVSFCICVLCMKFINIGANFEYMVEAESVVNTTSISVADFFSQIVPNNFVAPFLNNQLLPIIIIAVIIGFVVNKLDCRTIMNFNTECNSLLTYVFSYVIKLMPIGVFSLIATSVANFGIKTLLSAATYILSAYALSILILIVVMILPVVVLCKINPIEYIKKAGKVWITSLSTCSSNATLPVTMKVCKEEFHIPDDITNIVVPLGCTIHMCGGAISFALLAMFNMQLFNIELTVGMFFLMLITALLINMGAPGIPGGGIVIGATYLSMFGIPLDFIGFYSGIYRVLDMAYTTMNVTGDITANILINKFESKMTSE